MHIAFVIAAVLFALGHSIFFTIVAGFLAYITWPSKSLELPKK